MFITSARTWSCACLLACSLSPVTGLWHSHSPWSSPPTVLFAREQNASTHRNTSSAKRLLPGVGECGVKIANPPDAATMDCPTECPFIRPDTAHFCSFTCVKKQDCDNRSPLTSFADPLTHVCSPCAVPGCLSCGATRYQCLKCNDFMVLDEHGACVSEYRHAWTVVYYIFGIVFIFIVLYLVCLALRPEVNTLALERAEQYRSWSKLSHRIGAHSRPYPLDTNLCTENVAGAGVLLHFNWQRTVIIWATIVTFALFILSMIPPSVPDDMHPNDGDVFEACAAAGSKQLVKETKRADVIYLYFVFGIYIFSTVGSLLVFIRHRYLMRSCDDSDKLRHYALSASGFPPCSGEKGMEKLYTEFFEKSLPGIIGVSIAWDVGSSDLKLDSQVGLELDTLDRDRDMSKGLASTSDRPMRGRQSLTPRDVESGQYEGCLDPKRFGYCVDDLLLSAFSPDYQGCLEDEELAKQLENMTSTGTVFVVFQTRMQRDEACRLGKLEYEGCVISLAQVEHDPETMLWENRSVRSDQHHAFVIGLKCAGCVVGLFIAVTLWALLVYHPVSSYLLSFASAPGVQQQNWWDEGVQGALLSLPIMISNQLLYQVCDLLSSWIGFRTTGTKQLTFVVMYTVFVSFQTILDVWIVIQTAFGHHTESTWNLAKASGVLGSKAVAQNPSIRDTLYVEMVGYLYPGTLLLPYLLEPVGIGICQYLFSKWIIRSREHIGFQAAENLLLPLPYDLTRYGDILISTICCVLCCFIATPDVYKVFLYLLAMLLFCYVWDHWRVLRLAPRFFEDDNRLDDCVIMMLSLPCALLAAAVVFRKYGAHEDLYMTRNTAPMWCFFAFFIHLAFHLVAFCVIIGCVSVRDHVAVYKTMHGRGCSYENAAGDTAYNWFNTNHVHCLRSKYIHNHDPVWCVPVRPGREYLIQKEPKLGLFYEAQQFDPCDSARAELKELFGHAFNNVKDASGAAAMRASEVVHSVKDASSAAANSVKDASSAAATRASEVAQQGIDHASSAWALGRTSPDLAEMPIEENAEAEASEDKTDALAFTFGSQPK